MFSSARFLNKKPHEFILMAVDVIAIIGYVGGQQVANEQYILTQSLA